VVLGPDAEGLRRYRNIHNPSLTVFLPASGEKRAAVIIAPGGGHRHLAFEHEGTRVAEFYRSQGIAAFVLKYRLAKEEGSPYKVDVHALADIQQATRLVRGRAKEFSINPARVGVIGFSAGGELAALAASRYTPETRPDFQILLYPGGNLEAIEYPKDAPPAFLLGADDDKLVPAGFPVLYAALKKAGTPTEMHIYTTGGHGFGVRPNAKSVAGRTWLARSMDWLRERGVVN
jgi:endo-1,4-beta-xylanase